MIQPTDDNRASGAAIQDGASGERQGLISLVSEVNRNLVIVEAAIAAEQDVPKHASAWLEMMRVLFGGWPAFGLVCLVLFYHPLQATLLSIPEKVKSANEIRSPGFSITTLKNAASDHGLAALAAKIPKLSPDAIEYLLRMDDGDSPLITLSNDSSTSPATNKYSVIVLPSARIVRNIVRLLKDGLVRVDSAVAAVDVDRTHALSFSTTADQLESLLPAIRDEYPGSESRDDGDEVRWKLKKPIREGRVPFLRVSRTEAGKQAAALVLRVVSESLTRPPEQDSGGTAKTEHIPPASR